jgi:multidrug efflux system membrane fusion protein
VRALALGAILIGGSISGLACKKEAAASSAPPAPPPALVNVEYAIARDVPDYLDEIGKANASELVTVMPQVSGKIESLHFSDGADLKKNQPLFTIDVRPFEAALHQAEAQLAKDEATSANAERMLTRQSDIFKQGFVAPADYDTALFNAKAAKAAVEADQAAVASAKLNVEYCTIRSPIDGRAGMRLVDPGNVVNLNQTALLVIQRLDPIYADFTINERELPVVRAHMADHTLKTLVKLPTETDEGRAGDLTFLDNAVQDATGTIRLRATVPNADRRFWPGQFVNVRLVVAIKKNAVLVPTSAPQLGQGRAKSPVPEPFCYVVNNASVAEFRPVVLGQQQKVDVNGHIEDRVVIESGVKAGERVITIGQLLVFPGATVKVAGAPTMPPQTQPTTLPSLAQPTTAPSTQSRETVSGGKL